MNVPSLSQASPLGQPRRGTAPKPPAPPEDRVELTGTEGGGLPWKGLALGGLAVVGVLGGAQMAQAQVRSDVGEVHGWMLPKGKVDREGIIRNQFGWPLARITNDGRVTGPAGFVPKGRVDDQGRVYAYGSFFPSGRVEADGTVKNVAGVKVGTVKGEDPHRLERVERGGAFLLLHLQEN